MKKLNSFIIYVVLVLAIACILIVWLMYGGEKDLAALFTGCAFAATFVMLIHQNIVLLQQQFESIFHNMLIQLRTIVDGIEYGQNWFRGKDVFKDRYNSLKQRYKDNIVNKHHDVYPESIVYVLDDFKNDADYKLLENYFKFLYQILRYIDEPNYLSKKSKQNFANILCASLSPYELLMLFYHLFPQQPKIDEHFIRLVKKYEVFNNLDRKYLLCPMDERILDEYSYQHIHKIIQSNHWPLQLPKILLLWMQTRQKN